MDRIGIFPLGLVLFPESYIALHIFEERYKELINFSIDNNTPFGINLVLDLNIYYIGCTAKVATVLRTYPDGKMDITVTGLKRYNLIEINNDIKSYNLADIEYFDDNFEVLNKSVLKQCIDYFNYIADIVKSVRIEKIDMEKLNTNMPSFLIAQKSGMNLIQKQKLLEMRSENQRLNIILKHLEQIIPMIEDSEQINNIIKNDGYYRPNSDFFK